MVDIVDQAQELADSVLTQVTSYEKTITELKHMKPSKASRTGKAINADVTDKNTAKALWSIIEEYEIIKMVAKGKHKKSETVESNNVCKLINDILETLDHEDAGLYECSGKGTVYIPRG